MGASVSHSPQFAVGANVGTIGGLGGATTNTIAGRQNLAAKSYRFGIKYIFFEK
jgi:hypothetical protein